MAQTMVFIKLQTVKTVADCQESCRLSSQFQIVKTINVSQSKSLKLGLFKTEVRVPHRRVIVSLEPSLLRRLQTQTLPKAAPPIDKTHPFSKIAINFKPKMQF